jgi:hypothetical protein
MLDALAAGWRGKSARGDNALDGAGADAELTANPAEWRIHRKCPTCSRTSRENMMSDGWAVEVKMKVIGGGESTQTYYARVPDRLGAEEAVKKRINATPDVIVTAIAPVSASSFEGMNVKPGNVAQWIGRVP